MNPFNLHQLKADEDALRRIEARYRQVSLSSRKDRCALAIGVVVVFGLTVGASIALAFLYNVAEGRF